MNIGVVNDHKIFNDSLSLSLSCLLKNSDISSFDNPTTVLDSIDRGNNFDLLIADTSMAKMEGLTLLQALQTRCIKIPVVILSEIDNIEVIHKVWTQGAAAFITKTCISSCKELATILKRVRQGERYLSEPIQQSMKKLKKHSEQEKEGDRNTLSHLGITKKQLAVLKLLMEGHSNRKIASTLNVSEHTVKSHTSALFRKTGVHNRSSCIVHVKNMNLDF